MWIATERGFYSVVAHHQQPNRLLVRARKEIDLKNLFPKKRVIISKDKDYAYRVFVSRGQFVNKLIELGNEVQYTNFKSHIAKIPDQKDKVPFYSEIWGTMLHYQGKFIKGLYNNWFDAGFSLEKEKDKYGEHLDIKH